MEVKNRKKYLVTGGAGFIGSNIAKTLEAQGHEVTVLDDFQKNGHFKNLIGVKGDVIAADLFKAVPTDMYFDAIFHEAAITDTTVMDQKAMMEQNVEAFKNLLAYAAENEIKKVIYASSAATYGNGPVPNVETQPTHPENVYGFSKVIMDNVARQFAEDNNDMTIIGLRYFNVYGPGESFKGKMASMVYQLYNQMKAGQRPRVFKNGEQQRDFVYVKDIVKIMIPVAFQSIIAFVATQVDSLMLGRLDPNGLTATNYANQVYFITSGVISGAAAGANVLASQYYGKGEREKIKTVLYYALLIGVGFALLVTIACQLFPEAVVGIWAKDPELISAGARYLKVASLYFVAYAISTIINQTLRSVRIIRPATIFSFIAFGINAFLNWCLIFGNLGLPRLEYEGAAIATIIARVIECLLVLWFLRFKVKEIDFSQFKLFLQKSLPVSASEFLWTFGDSIVLSFVAALSIDKQFAYSTYSLFGQVCFIFMGGAISAAAILTGNYIGNGQDLNPLFKVLKKVGLAISAFNVLAIFLVSFLVPVIYDITPDYASTVRSVFWAGMIIEAYRARMCMDLSGILRGCGDVNFCFLNDVLFIWLWTVPISWLILKTNLPFWLCFIVIKSDQIIKYFTSEWRIKYLMKKGIKPVID